MCDCDLHGDLQCGSLGSFSSDICRLLQLREEEDDATSALAAPKPEPNDQSLQVGDTAAFQEVISLCPWSIYFHFLLELDDGCTKNNLIEYSRPK